MSYINIQIGKYFFLYLIVNTKMIGVVWGANLLLDFLLSYYAFARPPFFYQKKKKIFHDKRSTYYTEH